MGKKELKRIDTDVKVKKHGKKKRAGGPKGIVDVLNCPPLSHFYYELVVGNGIGDDAVEDALAAFERAWEVRRQKAYEAATQDGEQPTPGAAEELRHAGLSRSASRPSARRRRSAARTSRRRTAPAAR